MNPRFHTDYSGTNSFDHEEEQAVSKVITLFTGVELNDSTEGIIDMESSGGSGLRAATGIAGFGNLDAVRNPELSAEAYLARLWLRKAVALSDETVEIERSPLGLLTTLPSRRIDIDGTMRAAWRWEDWVSFLAMGSSVTDRSR
jgi:high affinity Mn2+ porin